MSKLPKPPYWLSRCDYCGWPLKDTLADCMEGNCSSRPVPPVLNQEHPETRKYIRALEKSLKIKSETLSIALKNENALENRIRELENNDFDSASAIGQWLSAALDDPNVCDSMKSDILTWFTLRE